MSTVKYPNVTVKLTGKNGNVFNLIALTEAAMKKGGVSQQERDEFMNEIMDADSYDAALQMIMKTVNVS